METNNEARSITAEGIVDQVFPERHSVRVTFPDKDNLTSAELPVLGSFCAGNSSYAMPDIGESVVVLNSTNDDESGTGFVIGARYDDKVQPKVNSIDKTRIDFKDGSFIEFDRSTGDLKIECKGNIYINGKNIYLNGGKNAARLGDMTTDGAKISEGSGSVFIG